MLEPSWVTDWRWNAQLIGWARHTRAFTAFVAYERSPRDPGRPPLATQGAASAQRFKVAIVGPACPERPTTAHDDCNRLPGVVERYWLRGGLDDVRKKLSASLVARQRQHDQHPAAGGSR